MTDRPPIPPALWHRILHFLGTKATGQVVLDVHQGRVQSVSLNERLRETDPVVPIETPGVPPLKTR